ncbi:MAG: hypothetical protein IT533_10775 [Hyphomicrobiales bacterium]|jgi:hypothetical protein|nr:hypothetical protein [Hyphomicrobiales bacterium]
MVTRVQRLKKLLAVQEQLKALHETRHAGHLAEAAAAAREAVEISERADAEDSLSNLFPDLYSRSIANAVAREERSRALASEEMRQIARATARTNLVERNYRDARRQDEREKGDRERLEAVSITHRKPG